MRRTIAACVLALAAARPGAAQSQPTTARPPEPAIRRWFEFQQFVLSTRYRFIESSADVVTSNHMQYREQIRARVNFDAKKRYTLITGFYSGNNFIGSWNNLGPGTGEFDGHDHNMRQLYFSATPVAGIEGQFGGIYVNRGETTEFASYDDDGYLVGGRLSIRRPKQLHLDELSVTEGTVGSITKPNLWSRRHDIEHPNYTQVLGAKRLSQMVSASVDYTRAAGVHTLRGGLALRFKPKAPISALRYEQYARVSGSRAAGFVLIADRNLPRSIRIQGGYATIDERYGGLNADRVQRGRRLMALATVPLVGPLSASFYATHALHSTYSVSNKTRFDAVLAWDVMASLRKTGKF